MQGSRRKKKCRRPHESHSSKDPQSVIVIFLGVLGRRGGEGGETPWQRPVANLRVSREGILAGVVASRGAWSTGRAGALTLFVLPTLHTSSGGGQQCRRRLCDGERSIIAAPAVPRSHYIRVLMSNMTLRPSSLQEET
ncbi:uncharacterized protein [Triticum aestivum]|uniref:uncharacterized protein isoform X2 n=1 Tax=Triticum aestivum TaxID=4565 RepID=UPI001D0072B4|nr:uncharacterized protein LOC123046371 isoform X2 [Triticum aestivum]